MRHIILMRHAEAGFVGGSHADFDRPLTEKGLRDATHQGKKLKDLGLIPDLVLCSPALRTATTWACVQKGIGDDRLSMDFALKTPQNLYQASLNTLLQNLHGLGEHIDIALILAHNPGIHELAQSLSQPLSGYEHSPQARTLHSHFPPATMAIFSYPLHRWDHATHETLTLTHVLTS